MNYKLFKSEDFEAIPKGEKINARVLDLEKNKQIKVFVFREEEGIYSCLLPVHQTTEKLPELKGLNIQYQEFKMPGKEMCSYVLLECRIQAYLDNYTEILKEIIEELDNGKLNVVKCIDLVISRWRHFLSEPGRIILEEEEIIGLIGELLLLDKVIDEYHHDGIHYWVADRGEEDFIKTNKIIEVKSTLKEKHEHIINGIDQLLIIPETNKYILSLLFFKTNSENSITLPEIIGKCSEKISGNPQIVEAFLKKLKLRRYDLRDAKLYMDYKYKCLKGGYFYINDTFPKLTTSELRLPLNSRISKVRYTLDLEGLFNHDFFNTHIKNIF